ncbi:hypothetical protein ACH4OV_20005 [Streptomyces diastaticus]|uniref:hypothetical protein n=1 Tax=Streptomyces diastaticus TaxID=1956 RepID=UPI00379EF9F6
MTATDNPQTPTAETDESQTVVPPAADAALGDAGKRALATLRDEVKSLKAELKKYQAAEPAPDTERDAGEGDDSTSGSAMPADADAGQVATTDDDVKPTPPQFQGTADAGARRNPAAASQLSAQDLRLMSPRAIEQARREGRLRNLLGGNGR